MKKIFLQTFVIVKPSFLPRSVIVRWEPPMKESQNGVITGYKIRWRPEDGPKSNRGEMVTTDGSRRLFAITGKKSFFNEKKIIGNNKIKQKWENI